MSQFLSNFPEKYTPNKNQVSILRPLENAILNNKKFIVINAPCGSGKTFLSKTVANFSKESSDNYKSLVDNYKIYGDDGDELIENEDPFGCFVLTITKSLQDQYRNTFDDTGILKGQPNYQCKVDEELTVDVAPCLYAKGLKNECWKVNKCPYYNDRNNMLKSKFSALNYSMFFALPNHLKRRKFIVCDEGSELEGQLVSQFTCEIDIPLLVKLDVEMSSYPSQDTPKKVLEWLSGLMRGVSEKVGYYVEFFKNSKDKIEHSKKKFESTKILNLQNKLQILIETFYQAEYLIEKIDKIIKFIPLKVDKISKYIFDYADHVIIMSATVIDPINFCKSLGIKDHEYISVDSSFDPIKSPIHIMAKQKINFANMKEMLPKLAKQVSEILEEHPNEKGIIHTHTQYIADYIRNNVKSNRLLCREAGVMNEELLDLHEQSKDATVLVSPSMTYGVDLKGDLGKFSILLKAPWLPTKETRVEKMMKIDKNWYSNRMLATLVQACGRCSRDEKDESVTYILDGSIFDAIVRNKSKLPKYFLDRLQ